MQSSVRASDCQHRVKVAVVKNASVKGWSIVVDPDGQAVDGLLDMAFGALRHAIVSSDSVAYFYEACED